MMMIVMAHQEDRDLAAGEGLHRIPHVDQALVPDHVLTTSIKGVLHIHALGLPKQLIFILRMLPLCKKSLYVGYVI